MSNNDGAFVVVAALIMVFVAGMGSALKEYLVIKDCKNYGQAVVGEYRLTCVKEK